MSSSNFQLVHIFVLATTSTRGRRRRTADNASEADTSTASVDESVSSKAEEPTAKKPRVEEKPKAEDVSEETPTAAETSQPQQEKPIEQPQEEEVVTEVRIESVVEITKEEPTTTTEPSNIPEPQVEFVDEVKLPTDLTEDILQQPETSTEKTAEEQPELVYEYEKVGVKILMNFIILFRLKSKLSIRAKIQQLSLEKNVKSVSLLISWHFYITFNS